VSAVPCGRLHLFRGPFVQEARHISATEGGEELQVPGDVDVPGLLDLDGVEVAIRDPGSGRPVDE
jgi:hypothetical protein